MDEREAVQYDRQIRLWGLAAQKRIRATRVLVGGAIRGLAVEVCKNLVLAGIHALTLIDDGTVTESDLTAHFFLTADDVGKRSRAEASLPGLQTLNPMVQVNRAEGDIASQPPAFFKDYDVVLAVGLGLSQLVAINAMCRANSVRFFGGNVAGFSGYFFSDQLQHHYVVEQKAAAQTDDKAAAEPSETQTRVDAYDLEFVPLSTALTTTFFHTHRRRLPLPYLALRVADAALEQGDKADLDALRESIGRELGVPLTEMPSIEESASLVQSNGVELGVASAVVGGMLGGEVIKVVSGNDHPVNNFFFFNAIDCAGTVELLGGASSSNSDSRSGPRTSVPATVIEL